MNRSRKGVPAIIGAPNANLVEFAGIIKPAKPNTSKLMGSILRQVFSPDRQCKQQNGRDRSWYDSSGPQAMNLSR